MNNILVWGNGFIGNHLKYDKIQDRATVNQGDIKTILKAYNPTIIINCIGFTGRPNIDQCETEKEKTLITNTVIPTIIASECDKLGIHMIHIGSGCIWNGPSPHRYCSLCNIKVSNEDEFKLHCMMSHSDKNLMDMKKYLNDYGWNENDPPNPVSFYSETKTACDFAIKSLSNVAILRIRMPISDQNSSRNFISKIRNYKQVIDIPNSATFVDDLVGCIDWAIENKKTGIYNVVNPEPITAAQVMKEYQKYIPDHKFEIITGTQLDQITKARRSNCILDGSKLRSEGFIMRSTKEALEETMKQYIENMKEK